MQIDLGRVLLPSKSPLSGCLITIEGPDGTGKSTQIQLLCDRLQKEGNVVVKYDFPHKSGTPIGELIGGFLRGEYGEVTPEFLALAFSLDRLESRDRLIADLAAGHTVVCDRYVASNIAFQRAKVDDCNRRGALVSLLNWVEYDLFKLPVPNIEIVLHADERYFIEGQHRTRSVDVKRDYIGTSADIHEDSTSLQILVNAYYAELPPSSRLQRFSIFDAQRHRLTSEQLHHAVWRSLAPELLIQ